METQNELVCRICARSFSSVSTKNRHLKTIHNKEIEEKISQHVKCPICPEDRKAPLANHDKLLNHLTKIHNVSIKITHLNFSSRIEFEIWRSNESREVDYTYSRGVKRPNGEEDLYFNCNRSNFRGYVSNYKKRAAKAGGSIRISGICPSRICAKILQTGMINVKFIETHVGHEDKLRTKRLLRKEQELIVKELNAGVSNERILEDARRIENNKLQRINLITRVEEDQQNAFVNELSTSKLRYQEELSHYLQDAAGNQNEENSISLERTKEILKEDFINWVNEMDKEEVGKCMKMYNTFKNSVSNEKKRICKKRKMEKQTYYPIGK